MQAFLCTKFNNFLDLVSVINFHTCGGAIQKVSPAVKKHFQKWIKYLQKNREESHFCALQLLTKRT